MDVLTFLGLKLKLKAQASGTWLVEPPTPVGNDRYWTLGDLVVVSAGSNWALAGKAPAIRLAGLDIALDVDKLPLKWVAGSPCHPHASLTSQALTVRLGASGSAHAMRIGAALVDDANSNVGFDPNDSAALGLFHSDFGFATGSLNDKEQALWVGLKESARLAIDLFNKQLVFAPSVIEARLTARTIPGPLRAARFANTSTQAIKFSEIAAGEATSFRLDLRAGDVAELNVDPQSGRPAVDVLSGSLHLTLASTGQAGGLVTAASLEPPGGGQIRLRFHAVRNSRNRAELWSTKDSVALAFRPAGEATWHSALIGMQVGTPPKLERLQTGAGPASSESLPLHGWFGASHFKLPSTASADLICSEKSSTPPSASLAWLDSKLQKRATRPWMRVPNAVLVHMRPGDAWQGSENLWRFRGAVGSGAGVPLLPQDTWIDAGSTPAVNATPLRAANREINKSFATFRLANGKSLHETGLADRTDGASGPSIQQLIPDGDVKIGEVRLESHGRAFEMAAPRGPSAGAVALASGAMRLPVDLADGQSMEFAVAWPALQAGGGTYPWVWLSGLPDWAVAVGGVIDRDAPIAIADILKDLAVRPKDFPLGILKLTRSRHLEALLNDVRKGLQPNSPADQVFQRKSRTALTTIADVDPSVLEASWVGLILFDVALDFEAFPMLKAVMPSDPALAPRFVFASVAPRDPAQTGAEVAMSASVDWRNGNGQIATPADAQLEASFQPRYLSIAFRDRKLVRFRSEAELKFYSFLGLRALDGSARTIKIVGSAQRVAGSKASDGAFALRFAAEVEDGQRIVIFPLGKPQESGKTFIKTIWFRRVEIIDAPAEDGKRKAEFDIDGSIEFQKPDYNFDLGDFFKKIGGKAVDFSGLRIEIDRFNGLDANLLKIKYPSLRFSLDLPHVALLGEALKLKFNQLIVDWTQGSGGFNFGQFPTLGLPNTGNIDLSLPRIVLCGRIDFGALPELFARTLGGLSLDGVFALNFDKNGLPSGLPFVGIGGFGFDRLDFDLASFLRLRIGQLKLGPAPWAAPPNGSALSFVDASLEILTVKVLEGGHGAFFSSDGESGNGFWVAFKGGKLSLLTLEWGFIGRNIDFPSSLPKALLTPPAASDKEENFGAIAQSLVNAWGAGLVRPASGDTARGWTFAAGLSAFQGAFRGRALLQDGGFTGLALYGEALRRLLGWNFVFVGLYRKNVTPGEDYFYFSVTLPPMTFGGIRFTGGAIAAEIYTSGDFSVDFGFPWRAPQGGRQWERTFGAIVTPGQASGGFYFRKRSSHLPDTSAKELTVAGGVALQWGLGAAFGGGVFEVWVRIGLYAIVEGEIVLNYHDTSDVKIVAFKLQGAAGVLLEGEGKIDWWVISVRVGIRASAEIRAALIWDGRPTSVDRRVLMPIEAELSVSAYAEACIGGGCARLCRGIDVHLNIPVRYQLQFG